MRLVRKRGRKAVSGGRKGMGEGEREGAEKGGRERVKDRAGKGAQGQRERGVRMVK